MRTHSRLANPNPNPKKMKSNIIMKGNLVLRLHEFVHTHYNPHTFNEHMFHSLRGREHVKLNMIWCALFTTRDAK